MKVKEFRGDRVAKRVRLVSGDLAVVDDVRRERRMVVVVAVDFSCGSGSAVVTVGGAGANVVVRGERKSAEVVAFAEGASGAGGASVVA